MKGTVFAPGDKVVAWCLPRIIRGKVYSWLHGSVDAVHGRPGHQIVDATLCGKWPGAKPKAYRCSCLQIEHSTETMADAE